MNEAAVKKFIKGATPEQILDLQELFLAKLVEVDNNYSRKKSSAGGWMILSAKEKVEVDAAIARGKEDFAAGRFYTVEEVRDSMHKEFRKINSRKCRITE